jgi:hypothetical protein
MSKTYLCYLHKPGVIIPELRVIASASAEDLPDAIMAELPTWGEFEVIDVYDERDHRLFSFTEAPRLTN